MLCLNLPILKRRPNVGDESRLSAACRTGNIAASESRADSPFAIRESYYNTSQYILEGVALLGNSGRSPPSQLFELNSPNR
jgi:hypothetical protein